MRSVVWTGHLHFGLVVMPVSLFAAARAETTRFRRIHRRKKPVGRSLPGALTFPSGGTYDPAGNYSDDARHEQSPVPELYAVEDGDLNSGEQSPEYEYAPVRQVLQSEVTGEELRPEELVKGYQYGPNQFAIIDPSQIERAAVETSETIHLFHFVKGKEVDPIYFERSYYLLPEASGKKAYALLLEAMRREGCFGIARIGMHKREHMLILRPGPQCLVAHTMFYVNEVRRVPEFGPEQALINDRELAVASALIKGYSGKFEPEKFKDIYQERIKGIIQAELTRTQEEPEAAPATETIVPDLMESIWLSLAQISSESENRKSKLPKKAAAKANAAPKKKKPQKALA